MTQASSPFSASGGGSLAAALSQRAVKRHETRPYDFRRPTKLSREHVRVLQIAQESFARRSTTVMTSLLRTGARLDLVDIEQRGYDDYVATLPNPTFIATFDLDPLPGKGMLCFPLDTAMASIDHMLGGAGSPEQPQRAMTSLEALVIGQLLTRLLTELGDAFGTLTAIKPELDSLEYNPALAQTAAGSETVMVSRYTMRVGLRETEATLCLPFSSFATPLKNASAPSVSEADRRKREQAARMLAQRLNQVPVDVAVQFNTITVQSDVLAGLQVGDVLSLRHPSDAPLEVTTNNVVFGHALSGEHRRRLAAQIIPSHTNTEKDN